MRRCLCPCGRPATGNSKYHHPATCRPRFHKLKKQTSGLTPRERKLVWDRAKKRQARAFARSNGGPIPSDDRVSFSRAVAAVQEWLEVSGRVDPNVAEDQARVILARARPRRTA